MLLRKILKILSWQLLKLNKKKPIEIIIRALNDEIGEQDEVINKLNKEKKHVAENQAKSNEDLVVAEEKVNHLNSIKAKLEETLDELEGALDKEKRARGKLDKEKRKVEGELKITQDMVSELERN